MYLDVDGNVTFGKGNLLATADDATNAALDWLDQSSGNTSASDDTIIAQWNTVKSHTEGCRFGGGWYQNQPWNTLYLTLDNIISFVRSRVGDFAQALDNQINFAQMPADAQLGLLAWAWGCGASFAGWPKMKSALLQVPPDFDTAANESVWKGQIFNRTLLIHQCLWNATDVQNQGLSFDTLLYPRSIRSALNTLKAGGREVQNIYTRTARTTPGGSLGLAILLGSGAYVAYKLWNERKTGGAVHASTPPVITPEPVKV